MTKMSIEERAKIRRRCCVKGCKAEVYYVHIDAYLELDDGEPRILRNEMMVYPMCVKHDDEFHAWLDKKKAKSNESLNKKIKIAEE